jgi:hypothetical protein
LLAERPVVGLFAGASTDLCMMTLKVRKVSIHLRNRKALNKAL